LELLVHRLFQSEDYHYTACPRSFVVARSCTRRWQDSYCEFSAPWLAREEKLNNLKRQAGCDELKKTFLMLGDGKIPERIPRWR